MLPTYVEHFHPHESNNTFLKWLQWFSHGITQFTNFWINSQTNTMVTTINRALNASKLFHCPVCIVFQGSTRWKFENCAARNIETDCHMILWTWTTLLIVKVLRSTMPRIAVPVPPGVKGLRASNCAFRMRFADLFGHGGLVSVGLYAMHFVFFGWLLQFSLL